MRRIELTKKEWIHLSIATLVLGFVFSFKEWGATNFDVYIGLRNLFIAVIAAFLALFLHELAHKIAARKLYAKTEFRTWSIKRVSFKRSGLLKREFPLGIVLSLFFVFLSNGKITLATLETSTIDENPIFRTRKKFSHLTHKEIALIALAGPLLSLFLAILFKALFFTNPLISKFVAINTWLAICSMLPLPRLDGLKIAMGSLPLYILSILFFAATLILISYLNFIAAIIIAIVIASTGMLLYLYGAK